MYGETHISTVLAGIISTLIPIATLLAALTAFGQQRPGPKFIGGLALVFTGVVLIGVWHGLGVVGPGAACILSFRVVSHAPAGIASSVTYLVPLFAVIVGAALLGEQATWHGPSVPCPVLAGAATSQDRTHHRRKKALRP